MEENLIALTQLPVIRERLAPLSAEIDRAVEEALSLAVTEETVGQVKKVRAKLRKDYEELEEQRKRVKRELLANYEAFMTEVYTPMIAVKYEDADEELKRKIREAENGLRQEKEEDLRGYFRERADTEGLPWLTLDMTGIRVTLSASMVSLRRAADDVVERVASDVAAILCMEEPEEILAEYKKTLRLGSSVETVRRRRQEIEQARREQEHLAEMRRKEREAEEAAARAVRDWVGAAETGSVSPEDLEKVVTALGGKTPEEEKTYTLTFTVTATMDKLRRLKNFLTEGGYDIA